MSRVERESGATLRGSIDSGVRQQAAALSSSPGRPEPDHAALQSASASSRRWMAVLAATALFVAQLPLVLAWCCGPPDQAGLGTFWFVNDFAQYESAMDQGARSSGWLVYNRFTPEAHQPALMLVLYVALGKLAATTGLPPETVYRAMELIGRLALVGSLAAFFIWLLGATRAAVLAFALSVFGMGLGAPVAVLGALFGLGEVYTGNGSYEVNTFGVLFSPPHVALALAITLALPMALDAHLRRPRFALLASLAGGGLALALLHPFHVPVLLLGLAVLGGLRWRQGATLSSVGLGIGTAALAAVPPLAYSAATFQLDPFWGATYGIQNVLPSPLPWQLPIDYGVLLPLAALGALGVHRRPWTVGRGPWELVAGAQSTAHGPRSTVHTWLLLWIALMLVAMYLPVPYQRRLGFGLQPALAALAAMGLIYAESWARSLGRAGLSRWLQPGVLGLALVTTATVTAGILASALKHEPMQPYRARAPEVQAATWLAQTMDPDHVVLASWDTSNYLAGRIPGRVVGGHPVATLGPDRRRGELGEFFGGDAAARQELALRHGADYVFFGPRERALGHDVESTPWLHVVYEREGVAVYRVEPPR